MLMLNTKTHTWYMLCRVRDELYNLISLKSGEPWEYAREKKGSWHQLLKDLAGKGEFLIDGLIPLNDYKPGNDVTFRLVLHRLIIDGEDDLNLRLLNLGTNVMVPRVRATVEVK